MVEGLGLLPLGICVVAGVLLARWAWALREAAVMTLFGFLCGLVWCYARGMRAPTWIALQAYPWAVAGAACGTLVRFSWRCMAARAAGVWFRPPERPHRATRWVARAAWAAGMALCLGWLFRPYAVSGIAVLGAAANSLPYAFLLSLMSGVVATLLLGPDPKSWEHVEVIHPGPGGP